jgi:hypothetical protein
VKLCTKLGAWKMENGKWKMKIDDNHQISGAYYTGHLKQKSQ